MGSAALWLYFCHCHIVTGCNLALANCFGKKFYSHRFSLQNNFGGYHFIKTTPTLQSIKSALFIQQFFPVVRDNYLFCNSRIAGLFPKLYSSTRFTYLFIWLHHTACGNLSSLNQGLNLSPLQRAHGVLAPGQPGKSPQCQRVCWEAVAVIVDKDHKDRKQAEVQDERRHSRRHLGRDLHTLASRSLRASCWTDTSLD